MRSPSRPAGPWRWLLPALVVAVSSACGDSGGGSLPVVRIDSSITSDQCVMTVAYDLERVVDSGQFRIDYSAVAGSFGEAGRGGRCRSLIQEATDILVVNRCDASCAQGEQRELYLRFIMGQPQDDIALHTPAVFFECLFEGDGASLEALAGQMHLFDKTLSEVDSGPLQIDVECDGWPATTTTTTSTTTSTLACQDDSCATGDVVPLQFWLDDAVTIGSIQFNVDFPVESGAFEQYVDTPAVRCTLGPGVSSLFATHQATPGDEPDSRQLRIGMIFGNGLEGPRRLLSCSFLVGENSPRAGDFTVRIVEASTPAIQPIVPPPSVSLRGLQPD